VRTAAEGRRKADLARDFQYIMRLYKQIEKRARNAPAPSLIYAESDLAIRVLRDVVPSGVDRILVDEKQVYERMRQFAQEVMPTLARRIRLYEKKAPLFEAYGIEEQVEELNRRRLDLPSGGWLTIEQTEALTAVDVNTGTTRAQDQETAALTTNLEAVDVLSRQLLLRDIGGLIVVDLIDMRSPSSRRKVERRMRQNLRQHKERFTLLPINRLGMMILTRQRRREPLHALTGAPCPTCSATGFIPAPHHSAASILRRIQSFLAESSPQTCRVNVHPLVLEALLNEYRPVIANIEQTSGCRLTFAADQTLNLTDLQISTT